MRHAMFLRGINVPGVRVPMAELRAVLTDAGLDDVATYQHTGNVTFASDRAAADLTATLEKTLSEAFAYDAKVLLMPADRVAGIVDSYPFTHDSEHHRYAVICTSAKDATELAALAADSEEVSAAGDVVYWKCPKGSTLTQPFSKVLARARWKPVTTSRNLSTLERMTT